MADPAQPDPAPADAPVDGKVVRRVSAADLAAAAGAGKITDPALVQDLTADTIDDANEIARLTGVLADTTAALDAARASATLIDQRRLDWLQKTAVFPCGDQLLLTLQFDARIDLRAAIDRLIR